MLILKKDYVKASNDNVIAYSCDDKTTKLIGNLSDNRSSWIKKETSDHDTLSEYKVKPFGICNIKTNETTVYCTTNTSSRLFRRTNKER